MTDLTGIEAPRLAARTFRVIVVDDVAGERFLLRLALETSGCFDVVGEAGDGSDAVALAGALRPDLVLLDLSMPNMDGLEAIPRLRRAVPGAVIVVNSGFEATRTATEALEMGASAYMEKGLHPEDLVARLLEVLGGRPDASAEIGRAAAGFVYESPVNGIPREAAEQVNAELAKANADLAKANADLERANADLQRTNEDLGQFAYVASHDLQEPLRMVASYVQLLANRYAGQLDGDADAFIGFAVNGATRMQALIQDLLAYSRVGTADRPFGPVDLTVVAGRVTRVLGGQIDEIGATVTLGDLPIVDGDEVLLAQLLQHLVGNALKFNRSAEPRIEIAARAVGEEWWLTVVDNGIGIEARHVDRIFNIFQRLHGRDDYPGTGIGLAICRRIADRHGGRIWVEPAPTGGSCFVVTLRRPVPEG